MGKGFNNYMCKKFFHPASRDNLKRVWMAEQKADAYKKKQEELRVQYEKEQDLYNNKAMLSKESKDKLSVNFMYEPPPGAKKEREREDDEPEYKFEWQRKFNAPREDYCKGDSEIRDQPFGIQVRNVRCIKCHKWGHINTDKECPMFKQASASQSANSLDPLLLVQQMKDDGLAMKRSALDTQHHVPSEYQGMIPSDDNTEVTKEDLQLLKSLSTKKKLKLLRKLEKMENGECSIGSKSNKSKKKKKTKNKERKSNEDLDEKESLDKRDKKKEVEETSSDSESYASSKSESKPHRGSKNKTQADKREKKIRLDSSSDLESYKSTKTQSKLYRDAKKKTQSDIRKKKKHVDSSSESSKLNDEHKKKLTQTRKDKTERTNKVKRVNSKNGSSSDDRALNVRRKRKHADGDDSTYYRSNKQRYDEKSKYAR